MYFEPQIRKQSKQTFKPVTQCLGACALTAQAMLASKMMLECGSDTRKRVLVVAVIEPFKDRSDALFYNYVVRNHLPIGTPTYPDGATLAHFRPNRPCHA